MDSAQSVLLRSDSGKAQDRRISQKRVKVYYLSMDGMKQQVPVPPWVGGDLPSILVAEPSQEQTPNGGVAPMKRYCTYQGLPPIGEREGGKCGINN